MLSSSLCGAAVRLGLASAVGFMRMVVTPGGEGAGADAGAGEGRGGAGGEVLRHGHGVEQLDGLGISPGGYAHEPSAFCRLTTCLMVLRHFFYSIPCHAQPPICRKHENPCTHASLPCPAGTGAMSSSSSALPAELALSWLPLSIHLGVPLYCLALCKEVRKALRPASACEVRIRMP